MVENVDLKRYTLTKNIVEKAEAVGIPQDKLKEMVQQYDYDQMEKYIKGLLDSKLEIDDDFGPPKTLV